MNVNRRSRLRRPASLLASAGLAVALAHCTTNVQGPETIPGNNMMTTTTNGPAPGVPGPCEYKDDASFCACLGNFDCGGVDAPDTMGINHAAYCGGCPDGQYCKSASVGDGFGHCTAGSPIAYEYQRQKINMLISMGEEDSPNFDYGSATNIMDGRGYTISAIGFTTGTGDFIFVAACYNDKKPGNILSKYWGSRDDVGRAIDGLIYYNDMYIVTGNNQADTSRIDKFGNFAEDVLHASIEPDGIFVGCEDAMAGNFYLAAAAQHAEERGLKGAETIGFLYDTELNFGDDPDTDGTPGAKQVMANADKDYGAGLPKDFTGKTWEESRWLGYVIKERTIVMSGNATWKTDMDQDATWEAARRLHTATSNNPESASDLGMDYDFSSQYKAVSPSAGGPCWTSPPLKATDDTMNSLWFIQTDKSASATDPTKWTAKPVSMGSFLPCPANPTP